MKHHQITFQVSFSIVTYKQGDKVSVVNQIEKQLIKTAADLANYSGDYREDSGVINFNVKELV